MLPADFVTCWQLSSARSFGNVFFPVWFGRLYWLGPMGILLVPACQLFPFLCKVFGSTLFHTRSLDCTAYFCSQFSVFMGYDLLLSLVSVWVLVCIRLPAGPAVLAVLPLPLLRVLTFFLTYTFGHLSFGSGPFPVLRLPLGGSLIPGLRVRFFLGFFSAFLSCFCAWVPCRLPFRRSVIPSGSCWTSVLLGSTGFLCAVACFAVGLLLHVFVDSFWTPLGVSLLFLLSGFPFPCSHFVFWIGSRGLCFCPRNFVPCNASTSSSGLAARLVLLGSCLFVAFSPYSGRGVLPSGPGFVLVPLPFLIV